MARFLLFGGSRHYPSGGFEDLVCQIETESEISLSIQNFISERDYGTVFNDYCWYHVVSAETFQIVRDSDMDFGFREKG